VTTDIAKQEAGILASLAAHYGMDKAAFVSTMKATIMGGKPVTNEQLAAFCLVAKEHGLNPFTKEIFAFPANGGIIPVVSVDGWLKLINGHPACDGMEFEDTIGPDGKLAAVTCKVYRKDRTHPVTVTEYMSECARPTDVWKKWPARMLRHKATIQAARYAFGFAGIVEPDEAERMVEPITVQATVVDEAALDEEHKWIERANRIATLEEYTAVRSELIDAYGDVSKVPAAVKTAFATAHAEVMPRDEEPAQ
jgi:phage recombination protein Bet